MNALISNSIIPVIRETFLRLRRDRIFLPAAVVGIGMLFLSGLASYWGIEEFYKILYDLGTTAFHLTGVVVAIFWGIKLINDSKQEGSVEVQLAAPIRRTEWILGKFFGLSSALVLLGLIFLIGWQMIYWFYGMGMMGWQSVGIFASLSCSWLVMAAAAILMATLSTQAVALFVSFWLLVCGLIAQPILQSLAPDTPALIRAGITGFTAIWDLQYFNLAEYGPEKAALNLSQVLDRAAYALALVAGMLALASLSFTRKDIHS
ncbi:MAG: ABC transporter permease [Oligoflexus sp.]